MCCCWQFDIGACVIFFSSFSINKNHFAGRARASDVDAFNLYNFESSEKKNERTRREKNKLDLPSSRMVCVRAVASMNCVINLHNEPIDRRLQ